MKSIMLAILLLTPFFAAQADPVYFRRFAAGSGTNQTFSVVLSASEAVRIATIKHSGQGGVVLAAFYSYAGAAGQTINDGYALSVGDVVVGPAEIKGFCEVGEATLTVVFAKEITDPSAFPVLPAGKPGTLQVEASSDLKIWTPALPGPVEAASTNRFYRVSLEVR